jgi:hypothetical protein
MSTQYNLKPETHMNPSIKFKTPTQFLVNGRVNSSIKRTSRENIVCSIIALIFLRALSANGQAPPGALWYNGDLDPNVAPMQNAMSIPDGICLFESQSNSHVYDDFNVPAPGWLVTAVFSDNLMVTPYGTHTPVINGVLWEIRQGISQGNAGTLIASGGTYINFSVTPTGRGGGTSECATAEYRVMVEGLNLSLPAGSYFLNVTPISEELGLIGPFGDEAGGSWNSGTDGADCVGTPCGNNNLAFINAPGDLGANWEPTTNEDPSSHDFAMGVIGNVLNQSPVLIEGGSLKQGFKIPMPINGESGIEDRSGQPGGAYTITMTFNENIASVARASASCGKVASTSIDGATLTINLTKVSGSCNASHMTVTANDVKDSAGINLGTACLTVGLLLGDVNGDGVVDSADLDIVNSQIGQPTNGENFRSDINNDGVISGADAQIVTRQQGTRLP